jgi:uncharacterized protein (DUF2141 family)
MLFASCAQVVAPGGGPRDTYAPKVVKYRPDSATTNFQSRSIELTFDEYIQLKDINNQLIISPPLEKTPEIKVKNKTMIIDFEDQSLRANTTYSINFGNALQDINENNSKENFSYIFSTGNFIDSLKVVGKVQNAFDHKSEKGIYVMLYSDMSDSAVYKKLPEYFSKTATDGSFRINNVKEGTYRIVTLKDLNSNFKYDGDPESIGFWDTLVKTSAKQNISINLFQEPASKVFIKKYSHPSYGKIMIVLNQGSDSLRVTNLSNDKKGVQEFIEFSKNKDTLTYWVKNYDKDSLKLQVNNGNNIIGTVEFKMIKLEAALKAKKNPLKLAVVNSPKGNQNFELNSTLKLVFNNPIADNTGAVQLKEDTTILNNVKSVIENQTDLIIIHSDTFNITSGSLELGKNTEKTTRITPFTKWKENTNYHLMILPGTLTDIFGLKNDTILVDFKTRESKYYGSLNLTLSISDSVKNKVQYFEGKNETIIKTSSISHYIIQLLDEKENVVRENVIDGNKTIQFEYLRPNKYSLKLIYDQNGNGKWDSGDYIKKKQAEKIIYNSEPINIRSNWDADIEWKVTGTNN